MLHDLTSERTLGSGNVLPHLRPAARPDMCRIDLRELRWCDPLGLVAVVCLVEAAVELDRKTVVTAPTEPNVARYLSRMRLDRHLDDIGAMHNLPSVQEHETGTRLLELTTFEAYAGADRVAELVYDATLHAGPDRAAALHKSVTEIGQNVPEHSGRNRGFVAAQRLRDRFGDEHLIFAVGDSGQGMLATLSARGAEDASSAIDLALARDVSETGQIGHGCGLPETHRLLLARGGSLDVVTGDAHLTATQAVRHTRGGLRAIGGVLVQGRVPVARANV